jgi:uncharacterized protein YndB with AHSA1/START domain
MTERSVDHATFVIERHYPAAPERVFAAWADPATKERWFGGPKSHFALDFRVGGREEHRGVGPDGRPYTLVGTYHDIVEPERIVLAYEMFVEGTRISVSLTTVTLSPDGDGTRLVLTEQGVHLDGHEQPGEREHGVGKLLDALAEELDR